ncbi:AarF/ABC1/UbiB kinase family protein [Haliangium ochraceum]|uniref:ABC transporter n=1 Tax=Haliangium ochraceum (strain DSM 14365 / JCM 11303 / SMP-2) TaxID=502025 RepID=D0LS38_HALO1|nr:AarF/ABC1/UbiB kinase family protein [Haliangium ochraceum]ACY13735.1 ABC-1 domain protein [Haliangium ochraceum DSM 14365]AMM72003.1 ABC transporter [Haliangium ochraceum DSM 14365]
MSDSTLTADEPSLAASLFEDNEEQAAAKTSSLRPSRRTPKVQQPGRLFLAYRTFAWIVAFIRVMVGLRLRRGKIASRAVHVRRAVEALGGPAVILARQFAMRLELFPLDIATELSRLEDKQPAMPLAKAVDEFERHLDKTLTQIFEVFDPVALRSSSLDCIYQASLHGGRKVIVRIMRPEAPLRIHAEQIALKRLVKLLAWLFPSYEERLVALGDELPFIEKEIVDFVTIARLHRLLKKNLKEWKVSNKFYVEKVFLEYCSTNVIVSEYVETYWLSEVLCAYESNDREALEKLHARNIDPKKCAARMFEFGLWSMLENSFSLVSPRVGQFAVMNHSKIMITQLGTVGTVGRYRRRMYTTLFQKLLAHDFEGMAELLIHSLFPLPPIDIYTFTKAIEQRLVSQLIAIENKDAPQWVRSGIGLWTDFLNEVRRFGVFVPAELSRAIQSLCVFSDIAFRLDTETGLRKRLRRYLKNSYRRGARNVVRHWRNPIKRGGSRFTSRPKALNDTLSRVQMNLEGTVDKTPLVFMTVTKKSGYALAQFFETCLLLGKITVIWLAISMGGKLLAGEHVHLVSEVWAVCSSPSYLVLIALFFAIMARRIKFRLDDIDPD